MSARQIQIRRGTEDEHANFTGAIGEITMDTTNKTLRVHDGETLGGTILAKKDEVPDINNMDYAVESQEPTAENNYTWYRKYKSGWVEQGGYAAGGGSGVIVHLIKEMKNTNYQISLTGFLHSGTAGNTASVSTNNGAITTTSFYVNNYVENGATKGTGVGFWWHVSGVAK